MRNIREYPVDAEEILDVLNQIPSDNVGIGNMTPMIKNGLVQFISRPEIMEQLVEHFRIK